MKGQGWALTILVGLSKAMATPTKKCFFEEHVLNNWCYMKDWHLLGFFKHICFKQICVCSEHMIAVALKATSVSGATDMRRVID